MVKRSEALCNGEIIGIESIYTLQKGQQINIPEKIKWLRDLSQQDKLFCPCGCGANLVLVAGESNKRVQHFRIKVGSDESNCCMKNEGKESLDSRIVLKCWLDDKFKSDNIKSRQRLDKLGFSDSQYELSLFASEEKVALVFFPNKSAIDADKISVIEKVKAEQGLTAFYITPLVDASTGGQYPETFMRLQDTQGFIIFIDAANGNYANAFLKIVAIYKNIDGFYNSFTVSTDSIKNYYISDEQLMHGNTAVSAEKAVLMASLRKKDEEYHAEKERKEKELAERIAAHQRASQISFAEFQAEKKRLQEERQAAYEAKLAEKAVEEKKLEERFAKDFDGDFTQNDYIIRDSKGNRWLKCFYCGRKAKDSEFPSYGPPLGINLGRCYICDKDPKVKELIENERKEKEEQARLDRIRPKDVCPECGGRLKEKTGRFGSFIGCMNYPDCDYTRKNW